MVNSQNAPRLMLTLLLGLVLPAASGLWQPHRVHASFVHRSGEQLDEQFLDGQLHELPITPPDSTERIERRLGSTWKNEGLLDGLVDRRGSVAGEHNGGSEKRSPAQGPQRPTPDWSRWLLLGPVAIGLLGVGWMRRGKSAAKGRLYPDRGPFLTRSLAQSWAESRLEPIAEASDQTRLVLVARDCHHAYAYWEWSQADRRQGLDQQALKLRLYDVTQPSHQTRPFLQYDCEAQVCDMQLSIELDNHFYQVELGYVGAEGRWQSLAISEAARVPACAKRKTMTRTLLELELEPGTAKASLLADPLGDRTWIRLLPVGPRRAKVEWHISQAHLRLVSQHQGEQLVLKIHDAEHLDFEHEGQAPDQLQVYDCQPGEASRWVELPLGDRDYVAEIGYLTSAQQWLHVARSVYTYHAPATYEACRILLLACAKPLQVYLYWDIAEDRRQMLRQRGGKVLVLRLYALGPHITQRRLIREYPVNEAMRDRLVRVPAGDCHYEMEIGYLTLERRFLSLGRSCQTHVARVLSSEE